jgi:hypothetical protein
MPNISASSYSTFRTCPRLYYFQYVLRLRLAREEGARRFGTLYHAGLEAWWRAMDGGDLPWKDKDEALVLALKGIADNARHVNTDPFEVARAEALMTGYHYRYFDLDFTTVDGTGDGVEQWFKLPLVDAGGIQIRDWWLTGRKDVIKRFEDGRVKIVEHKHTSYEINGASDYWAALKFNTQCSIYIDAAQRTGTDTDEALYDVSKKPGMKPLLATPVEKRKTTKGKGCKYCGGRAGGKAGVAQGTGMIMVRTSVDADGNKLPQPIDVEVKCTSCKGEGWDPDHVPRLQLKQRLLDEKHEEFRARVAEEIADDPDAHYRMGKVTRTKDQLMEARADVAVTAAEIDALTALARASTRSGELATVEARRCFPRNTQTCTDIYGRRCDFLDACSGALDPMDSPLYQLGSKPTAAKVHITDANGVTVVGGVE